MRDGGAQVIHPEVTALERDSWCAYFDSLAARRAGLLAAVSLPGLDRDGGWNDVDRPLHGIRYDAIRDEIELAVRVGTGSNAALRYFVGEPRSISVEELGAQAELLRVTDARGTMTLIRICDSGIWRLTRPLMPARRTRSAPHPIG